ncbi:hypothetical protein F4780DRAFT_550768 [Xylariomycetidae sp. FL0641]|nr:hypothetical protein F4780DRAFT_550768 [Xylariomycetidae sp. FL0641]
MATLNHSDDDDTRPPHARALARLQALQPVLAGLAHRNKNQHRRSAWWGALGLLRRQGVARLIDALLRLAPSQKRRAGEEEGVVRERARWLREVLAPEKCYRAFAQLSADNQFATLGVVLLAALAEVHAVCGLLAPPPPLTEQTESVVGSSSRQVTTAEDSGSGGGGGGGGGGSGGKTISRADVAKLRGEALASSEPSPAPAAKGTKRRKVPDPEDGEGGGSAGAATKGRKDEEATAKEKKKKRVKQTLDDEDDVEVTPPLKKAKKKQPPMKQATADDEGGEATPPPKKTTTTKKKKKKAKKGDEFDDMFKGLL